MREYLLIPLFFVVGCGDTLKSDTSSNPIGLSGSIFEKEKPRHVLKSYYNKRYINGELANDITLNFSDGCYLTLDEDAGEVELSGNCSAPATSSWPGLSLRYRTPRVLNYEAKYLRGEQSAYIYKNIYGTVVNPPTSFYDALVQTRDFFLSQRTANAEIDLSFRNEGAVFISGSDSFNAYDTATGVESYISEHDGFLFKEE